MLELPRPPATFAALAAWPAACRTSRVRRSVSSRRSRREQKRRHPASRRQSPVARAEAAGRRMPGRCLPEERDAVRVHRCGDNGAVEGQVGSSIGPIQRHREHGAAAGLLGSAQRPQQLRTRGHHLRRTGSPQPDAHRATAAAGRGQAGALTPSLPRHLRRDGYWHQICLRTDRHDCCQRHGKCPAPMKCA